MVISDYLLVTYHSKHFSPYEVINSLNPCNSKVSPSRLVLLSPKYSWGKRDTENVSNLTKVILLVSQGIGIHMRAVWAKVWILNHQVGLPCAILSEDLVGAGSSDTYSSLRFIAKTWGRKGSRKGDYVCGDQAEGHMEQMQDQEEWTFGDCHLNGHSLNTC